MSASIDIDHLARLARLALTPEEKAAFSAQLAGILDYAKALDGADVQGVEPMAHAIPVYNVWEADVPRPGLSPDQALLNAPARRQGMFSVPQVVE